MDVSVDALGNSWFLGVGPASFPPFDVQSTDKYVLKLSPDGSPNGIYTFWTLEVAALSVRGSDTIAVAGRSLWYTHFGQGRVATTGTSDAFVAMLGATPTPKWSRILMGMGDDKATGVAVDSLGRTVVVGSFSAALDVGGMTLTAPSGINSFVVQYGP